MLRKNRICRLCLSNNPVIDIFSDYSIRDKIVECCGFDIDDQDGLPPKICNACFENINSIVHFKSKCQENNLYLREQLNDRGFHRFGKIEKITFQTDDYMTFFQKFSDGLLNELDSEMFYSEVDSDDLMSDQKQDKLVIPSELEVDLSKLSNKNPKKRVKKERDRGPKLCPKCGEMIPYRSFKNHYRIHKNHDSFVCDICNKVAKTKANLILHLKIHDEKKEACEYCGKLFIHRYSVKKHIHQFHLKDDRVKCKTCGKMYNKGALKIHELIHLGVKPFECNICRKTFSSKNALDGHIRIHTGEKPYKCKYCDSHFRIACDLRAHVRLHTGETPYECSVCARGYAQLGNLKSHFKNNHKGIEFSYVRKKSTP